MDNTSKLLINESPLQVLPSLACLIGLNDAIVLQQLHYWIVRAESISQENQRRRIKKMRLLDQIGIYKDGRYWIYNTLEGWQVTNFPFWSTKTIERIFLALRDRKLVDAARLGPGNRDQTLYYTVNYDRLDVLFQEYQHPTPPEPAAPSEPVVSAAAGNSPDGQVVPMDDKNGTPFGQDVLPHLANLSSSIGTMSPSVNIESEITSETTQRGKGIPLGEAWKGCQFQLKGEMRKGDYDTYIEPLKVLSYSEGIIRLGIADQRARDWVNSRLRVTLRQLLSGYLMTPVGVVVECC